MGCHQCKTTNINKKLLSLTLDKNISSIILKEKGRLQFFYHSPSSEYPIRDILDEQKEGAKTEPHIEIGAENYWSDCLQDESILPLINNNEKYLFLMTTCRNKKLRSFNGNRYIVGYIERVIVGTNCRDESGKEVYFVKGNTQLYSFKDSISTESMGFYKFTRVQSSNEEQTRKILCHFKDRKNIYEDCVREIIRLDKENKTCIMHSKGIYCMYQNECIRWKLQ